MPKFTALPTEIVHHWRAGGPDANGQTPEHARSDGHGNRCRHCLRLIPEGAPYLIVAHRPFDTVQPYAETGPLFVCARDCTRHADDGALPDTMTTAPDYLIKGYSADERIIYGTGQIVTPDDMLRMADDLFSDPRVAFIHIRSARNNCYQARIDRDATAPDPFRRLAGQRGQGTLFHGGFRPCHQQHGAALHVMRLNFLRQCRDGGWHVTLFGLGDVDTNLDRRVGRHAARHPVRRQSCGLPDRHVQGRGCPGARQARCIRHRVFGAARPGCQNKGIGHTAFGQAAAHACTSGRGRGDARHHLNRNTG